MRSKSLHAFTKLYPTKPHCPRSLNVYMPAWSHCQYVSNSYSLNGDFLFYLFIYVQ